LVLLRLVGANDSIPRAVMMALHLTNTSLLTGAIAYTAWASGPGRSRRLQWRGTLAFVMVAALLGTLVTSGIGAVTALGDTLYPVSDSGQAVAEGLAMEPGVSLHFLQRMRVVHPVLAMTLGLALLYLCGWVVDERPRPDVSGWARIVRWVVLLQLAIGLINVGLSAPGWMQIVHLLMAVVLWIALMFLTFAALATQMVERQ
jgi:heme A synthase